MIWSLIKLSILVILVVYLIKKFPAVKAVFMFLKDKVYKLIDWIKSKFKKDNDMLGLF